MKKAALAFAAFCLIAGCEYRDKEISFEKGKVIKTEYMPDTRKTTVGYGMSSSGHLVTTFTPTGEDEKYLILFKCEHQVVFPVERKDLFFKLAEGDSVNISFYNIRKKDGRVVGFKFINAEKAN